MAPLAILKNEKMKHCPLLKNRTPMYNATQYNDIIYIKRLSYFSTKIGSNPINYLILDFGYPCL
jgi:hypothetical protein